MNKLFMDRNPWVRICVYAFVVATSGYVAYEYVAYMEIAKSTVPIMDYWQWIATYGQKVFDGTITFADYFNSDLGEHIQPVCMFINFFVLKLSLFDVKPLVEWGMILRIVFAALLVVLFVWRQRNQENKNYLLQLICTVAIFMSVLNYNQWEMTTEPFSLTNAFRVGNYFLSFYLADIMLKNMGSRSTKSNLIYGALFGCYCAFLTIFVGAAYFVGHLVAIGIVMLWTLVQQRYEWKKYFWPMAMWGVISFASACVYYFLFSRRGVSREAIETTKNILVVLIQSVCFFWGGLFIHAQTMEVYGDSLATLFGALMLVYTIYILIHYLKNHRTGKELFPAMCVIYAIVLSVAISAGRVTLFGPSSLAASRYVVETSIGLAGVVWMTYSVCLEQSVRKFMWIKYALCVCVMVSLLVVAKSVETQMAPYRAIYNDNLAEMMVNLENYSDEELAVFQADPTAVRYCVEFFQENNLSIFCEIEP